MKRVDTGELRILSVENGFIVMENVHEGYIGRQWAFEKATSLAEFVDKWGVGLQEARESKEEGHDNPSIQP